MKTKEELNAIKDEFETLNKKLAELSNEELAQVTGGCSQIVSKGGTADVGTLCGGEPTYPAKDDSLHLDEKLDFGVRLNQYIWPGAIIKLNDDENKK